MHVAKTQKEIIDNFLIRGEVFIKGQNIDWDLEFDGLDDKCVLFVCYMDKKAVGAARLYKNKVGRVATLEQYRKKGVGRALMDYIEDYAKNNSIKTLKLNAQLYIKQFYLNLGYIPQGNIFLEADIQHVKMTKEISHDERRT